MVRPRPYIFCRYSMLIDEEWLDAQGQLAALQELQGNLFAHGPKAEREGRHDTIIMRPRQFEHNGEEVLTWSVGQKLDARVGAIYNEDRDQLEFIMIDDRTVRYNDFVAVPRLGVLAVDDRTGDKHMSARGVISRMRTAFPNLDNGAINIEMETTQEDVDKALQQWELTEVSFKVRPVNPHSRSDLSQALSDAMKQEGIGNYRATARPAQGQAMRVNDGPLAQGQALTQDGYGQMGVRGVMPDGHVAYIPRPQLQEERSRNERLQEKPRELRVYIETEGDTDDESFANAASALVGFYDRRQ